MPYDTRYSKSLGRKIARTKLIVKSDHDDNNHLTGIKHMLILPSKKFWIVFSRETFKKCESNCMKFKRRKSSPGPQLMVSLPEARLRCNVRAFSSVGIDFAGQFLAIQGRGKARNKS